MVNFLEIILPYGPGGRAPSPYLAVKTSLFGPGTRTFRPEPPEPMEHAIDSAEPREGERIQIADLVGGKSNLSAAIAAQAKGGFGAFRGAHMPSFRRFPPVNLPGPIKRLSADGGAIAAPRRNIGRANSVAGESAASSATDKGTSERA